MMRVVLVALVALVGGCVTSSAVPLTADTLAISATDRRPDAMPHVRRAILERAAKAAQAAGKPCFRVVQSSDRAGSVPVQSPVVVTRLGSVWTALPMQSGVASVVTMDAVVQLVDRCGDGDWRAADVLRVGGK